MTHRLTHFGMNNTKNYADNTQTNPSSLFQAQTGSGRTLRLSSPTFTVDLTEDLRQ